MLPDTTLVTFSSCFLRSEAAIILRHVLDSSRPNRELLPADAGLSDVGKQTDSYACGRPAPSTPMIGLFAAFRPNSRELYPLLEARSPRRVACFVTSGAARSSLLTPPTDPRRLPHSHTRCRVHFSAPFPPFPVSCLAASSISSFAVPARREEFVNRVRAPLFDCFHCTNGHRAVASFGSKIG